MGAYEALLGDASLVARWNGDANFDGTGDANDVRGVFNASWTGTAAYAAPLEGGRGKSFSLSGSNYLTAARSITTQAYTVACHFSTTNTNEQRIFGHRRALSGGTDFYAPCLLTVTSAGFLQCVGVSQSGTIVTLTGAASVRDGVRHHAAATYDGTTLRLYCDGALVASGALANIEVHVDQDTRWGYDRYASGTHFVGSLSECVIFSRAFTRAEVNTLSDVVVAEAVQAPIVGHARWMLDNDPNLVLHWRGGKVQPNNAGSLALDKGTYTLTGSAALTDAPAPNSGGRRAMTTGVGAAASTTAAIAEMPNARQLTYCAWVYWDSLFDTRVFFSMLNAGAGTAGFNVHTGSAGSLGGANTSLQFNNNSSTWSRATPAGVIAAGAWYHVAIVLDLDLAAADRCKIFVNGVRRDTLGSGTAATALTTTAVVLRIGANINDSNAVHIGKHDDVRLYTRALTAREIVILNGPANPKPTVRHINAATRILDQTEEVNLVIGGDSISSTGVSTWGVTQQALFTQPGWRMRGAMNLWDVTGGNSHPTMYQHSQSATGKSTVARQGGWPGGDGLVNEWFQQQDAWSYSSAQATAAEIARAFMIDGVKVCPYYLTDPDTYAAAIARVRTHANLAPGATWDYGVVVHATPGGLTTLRGAYGSVGGVINDANYRCCYAPTVSKYRRLEWPGNTGPSGGSTWYWGCGSEDEAGKEFLPVAYYYAEVGGPGGVMLGPTFATGGLEVAHFVQPTLSATYSAVTWTDDELHHAFRAMAATGYPIDMLMFALGTNGTTTDALYEAMLRRWLGIAQLYSDKLVQALCVSPLPYVDQFGVDQSPKTKSVANNIRAAVKAVGPERAVLVDAGYFFTALGYTPAADMNAYGSGYLHPQNTGAALTHYGNAITAGLNAAATGRRT